ncbi:voltage-dependent calcium channel subunit alpha-2/delta-3-like isoform X2 [Biomphalaria glabrata]|uniref:Voltage-dependent calcium channel subunit alpha-2/delta-3-like isoform X2 n=1 Tax=Biomphalaria glabrata TaxID=6526 RepID=A0A9W3A495_BIOGL|nr:voltage-dependent calcium channel subunit alpha-2/delta-3-like isoform X2 [Biomphalaria glabrata]
MGTLHMDIMTQTRRLSISVCMIFILIFFLTCNAQRLDNTKNISGLLNGADNFQKFFLSLAQTVTGTGIFANQHAKMSVVARTSLDIKVLLSDVKRKMEDLLDEKKKAVMRLKAAAQNSMKNYGAYTNTIDFNDVKYYNAKKVVIETDLENMDNDTKDAIKETINYLPTEPMWSFKKEEMRPKLNVNLSSIHVPTNIYDKSVHILNGVQWSSNLTDQFVKNAQADPTLTWQYFCSSDGFFRIYPAMQWPREADKVDTFDCRIRKWYIQAASSPKHILILLDSSGSMKGLRFAIARSTVSKILETLSDEDYFNVIAFSEEARYVDECFNDTLIPASVDNIRRVEEKLERLEASNNAYFDKALRRGFQLFKKEHVEYQDQCLCNKAIMLVTDGAPENFDSIFDEYNWPNKTVRVFTFLIGKEVPDNRQTKWMACANKGLFTHISTRADVQENVQKYIKVLSKPLAMSRSPHHVWSPAYIDYVTEQSDIKVPTGRPESLHVDFDSEYEYEGLGLVMSISMPVYDERDKVSELEEDPRKNLLGVVGTDVRINELMKFIPTYQLGVNGYAFAITNHGYVLFHPDYRPFYKEKGSGPQQTLKVRPKYNSVELSEVELPNFWGTAWNRDHPLRRYLLTSKSGGENMTAVTILTHSDGMTRARERKNQYQFMEIANTFRLVFVLPEVYGTHYIKLDNFSLYNLFDIYKRLQNEEDTSIITLSKWIYCPEEKTKAYVQLNEELFSKYLEEGTLYDKCDREHMKRLLEDLHITEDYLAVWKGAQCITPPNEFSPYHKCWSQSTSKKDEMDKEHCFFQAHTNYGIGGIWIGTSSGLTRKYPIGGENEDWHLTSTDTIKSAYYKMAVDGWEDGYRYVFSIPVVTSPKDFNPNTTYVTIAMAELVGQPNNKSAIKVPAAVVAFSMNYSAFYSNFVRYTFQCPDSSCLYTCNGTEHFTCYLIDSSGYIVATNNADKNGTGVFLGQQNSKLMRTLLYDKIFKHILLTDYQSICDSKGVNPENSSNFIKNPLKILSKVFFWIISEVILFMSQMNIWNLLKSAKAMGSINLKDLGNECGAHIEESFARFVFCDVAIDEDTGHAHVIDDVITKRACVQNINRYTLNLKDVLSKTQKQVIPSCQAQCASPENKSYIIKWLNETNLLFVVHDSSCICNNSQVPSEESSTSSSYISSRSSATSGSTPPVMFYFNSKPKEVLYIEETQCQILRNFSNELKRVDSTRASDVFCLDAANETDTPCGQSSAMSNYQILPAITFGIELTVLLTFTALCCH